MERVDIYEVRGAFRTSRQFNNDTHYGLKTKLANEKEVILALSHTNNTNRESVVVNVNDVRIPHLENKRSWSSYLLRWTYQVDHITISSTAVGSIKKSCIDALIGLIET